MKQYRFGEISYWTGAYEYCIQEKRWWGWKNFIKGDKDHCLKYAKKLEGLGHIVIYS